MFGLNFVRNDRMMFLTSLTSIRAEGNNAKTQRLQGFADEIFAGWSVFMRTFKETLKTETQELDEMSLLINYPKGIAGVFTLSRLGAVKRYHKQKSQLLSRMFSVVVNGNQVSVDLEES